MRGSTIKKILILILTLLILTNTDTLNSIYSEFGIKYVYLLLALTTTIFCILFIKRIITISINSLMLLVILSSSILITILLNYDFTGGYGLILIGFVLGFMLINMISFDLFIETTILVMVFLCFYSIMTSYIFRDLIIGRGIYIKALNNSSGIPLINVGFNYIINVNGYYRNFGIFRESGVYQAFINFALMFELFFVKREIKFKNVFILVIGVLSTFSPVGYINSLCLVICYLIRNGSKQLIQNKKIILGLVIFLFIFLILLNLSSEVNTQFKNSWAKLFNKESSYMGRTISLKSNIDVWLNRPYFGHGITKGFGISSYELRKNATFKTNHNTSTTTSMLVVFGFIFTSVIHFCIFLFVNQLKESKVVKLLCFATIMFSINSQLLIYNEFLYVLVFYGIQNVKKSNYDSLSRKQLL